MVRKTGKNRRIDSVGFIWGGLIYHMGFPGGASGKEATCHILAWRIPRTEEPGGYSP